MIIAYDFSGDLDMLHQSIPSSTEWKLSHLLDMKIIKSKHGEVISGGLAGLVFTFLGVGLNKRQQLSNWEMRPLSDKQITYGACDAIVLLDIYNKLCQWKYAIVKDLPKLLIQENL
jgi:ribonuclease D